MKSKKIVSVQGHLGQEGVNLIEKIVLQMGSSWTPGGPNEVGIDGYIELFDPNKHESTGKNIAVQSKATNSFSRETENSFEFWCDRQDIEYWLNLNIPIILIVSRPKSNEAYWVSIHEYFKDYTRKTSPRVFFSKKEKAFTQKSFSDLYQLSSHLANRPSQVIQTIQSEKVISNLIPITRFPDKIYHAFTDFRKPNQLWAVLRKTNRNVGGAWILREKGILSFYDLSELPWCDTCDVGTVESFDAEEWAFSDDSDRLKQFVQLLNCTLRTQLSPEVRYWPREDCYAFVSDLDKGSVKRTYKSAQKRSTITVVRKFVNVTKDGREFPYLRHLSFHCRIILFENTWHLEITPTYRFTSNGSWLYRFHEDLIKGIKRIEGNRAVLSALLFWADYLNYKEELFQDEKRYLDFGPPLRFEIPKGLDDSSWGKPKSEKADNSLKDDELLQLSLFDGEFN